MIGLGTIINTAAVVGGGLVGLLFKKGLAPRFQNTLMQALGISTVLIALGGVMKGMLTIHDGIIETGGTMLLIISLIFGAIVGEAIDIEARLERFGEFIRKKVGAGGDSRFVDGFMSSSLVICVGAMGVVGSVNDGLNGDSSVLIAKAALDLVIVMIFASTMGLGVVFSAVPLFIYQGSITLLAKVIAPFISDTLVAELSFVGSALILLVGLNLSFGDSLKNKFRAGNMIPALIVPIICEILRHFGVM